MKMKKFLSVLLAAIMVCSMLPMGVFATDVVTEVSTYDELTAALAAGKNVKLMADITFSGVYTAGETIKIPVERTDAAVAATLDLNGHTISQTNTQSGGLSAAAFAIRPGSSLTLKDTSAEQTGAIEACNSAFQLEGTLNMEGGKIVIGKNHSGADVDVSETGNGCAYGVWMYMASETAEAPEFIMTGGSIEIEDDVMDILAPYNYANAVACAEQGTSGVASCYDNAVISIDEDCSVEGTIIAGENTTVSVPETVSVTRLSNAGETVVSTYAELVAALAAGGYIKLVADIVDASAILTVTKDTVINGNDKTLTSTATRAINVDTTGSVTIQNLVIDAGERAINIINKPATVVIDDVTATASNNAVMIATSAGAAKVTISDSTLTGLAVVNVAGVGADVTIENTDIVNVDATESESYGAITVWSTGTNATVNVTGGSITVAGDSKKAEVFAEGATVTGVDDIGYIVATVGDAGFHTLAEAVAYANAGNAIVKLVRDVTLSEILTIDKAITLDGNDKTLTSTAARAINVDVDGEVTIKNLTIVASGERAINVINNPVDLTIDSVTATAANYTVNLAASAADAVVAIENSTLNGLCTVNVNAEDARVTVNNSTVNCNDNNTTEGESYAALCLNMGAVNGSIIATNTVINVTEGSDSVAARKEAQNGTITIDGSAEDVSEIVAVITYEGSDYYYGFWTLAEAIEDAEDGDTITLVADVTVNEMLTVQNKSITIDLNGKTITAGVLPETSNMVLYITNSAAVVIDDSVGTGGIVNDSYYGYAILNQGTLTVNGGNFTGDTALWNGYDTINSTATLNGGTFSFNHYNSAEAGYSVGNSGTLVVNDGTVINDWVETYGAMTVNGGTVEAVNAHSAFASAATRTTTITGGTIGEVYVDSESSNAVSITGGTFATDVSDYCADGFVITENADGSYDVMRDGAYARIGSTYFDSLADAIKNAEENDTVVLLKDIEVTTYVTINKSITLDLNEKSITRDGGTALYINGENITVTIKGEGTITSTAEVLYVNAGTVKVEGGTFKSTVDKGPAVYVINNGHAEIYGGHFSNNNGEFVLNEYDKTRDVTTITVYGGTFVNFNPSNNAAENAYTNFTPEGYAGVYDADAGTYTVTEDAAVATVKTAAFATLEEAIAAAKDGGVVEVIATEITLDEMIKIEKAITLNLNGCVVTANCKKAFEVYADTTINNGTINSKERCVDTRKAVELTLNDVTLSAPTYYGANQQPLTISGDEDGTVVKINGGMINAGYQGYAIISFVKCDVTVNAKVTGYRVLYVKEGSAGSTFTFNSCNLTGNLGSNDVANNATGAIAFEDAATVTINGGSIYCRQGEFGALATNASIFEIADGVSGVNATADTDLLAGDILMGEVIEGNTIAVQAQFADELAAEGFTTANVTGTELIKINGLKTEAEGAAGTAVIMSTITNFDDGKDYCNVAFLSGMSKEVFSTTGTGVGGFEVKIGETTKTFKIPPMAYKSVTVSGTVYTPASVDKDGESIFGEDTYRLFYKTLMIKADYETVEYRSFVEVKVDGENSMVYGDWQTISLK